jgi:hypothetical protein
MHHVHRATEENVKFRIQYLMFFPVTLPGQAAWNWRVITFRPCHQEWEFGGD